MQAPSLRDIKQIKQGQKYDTRLNIEIVRNSGQGQSDTAVSKRGKGRT